MNNVIEKTTISDKSYNYLKRHKPRYEILNDNQNCIQYQIHKLIITLIPEIVGCYPFHVESKTKNIFQSKKSRGCGLHRSIFAELVSWTIHYKSEKKNKTVPLNSRDSFVLYTLHFEKKVHLVYYKKKFVLHERFYVKPRKTTIKVKTSLSIRSFRC